jgi:hypothetical protein
MLTSRAVARNATSIVPPSPTTHTQSREFFSFPFWVFLAQQSALMENRFRLVQQPIASLLGRVSVSDLSTTYMRFSRYGWSEGHGRFHRRFVLPETVDAEKANATGKSGMLTTRIPKQEKSKPRRIQISG